VCESRSSEQNSKNCFRQAALTFLKISLFFKKALHKRFTINNNPNSVLKFNSEGPMVNYGRINTLSAESFPDHENASLPPIIVRFTFRKPLFCTFTLAVR